MMKGQLMEDSLEARLDRSTPPTEALGPERIEAMIAHSRSRAGGGRRAPGLVIGTVLAVGLLGGAGAAAAGGLIEWAPELDDAVGGVQFTMSNGFTCEIRTSKYTLGADDSYIAEINRELEDWYATGDVIAAAERELPEALARYDGAAGGAAPASADSSRHQTYLREWMAWNEALMDAEHSALESRGFAAKDPRRSGSERMSQIVCFDESGDLYVPGPDA